MSLPFTMLAGTTGTRGTPAGWNLDALASSFTIAPITWGAAVAIDAALGSWWRITATSNTAYTVAAPTGLLTNALYVLTMRNTSGGAMGAATYNAIFHLAGAFTNPANGNSRSVLLLYDGSILVEVARSVADALV